MPDQSTLTEPIAIRTPAQIHESLTQVQNRLQEAFIKELPIQSTVYEDQVLEALARLAKLVQDEEEEEEEAARVDSSSGFQSSENLSPNTEKAKWDELLKKAKMVWEGAPTASEGLQNPEDKEASEVKPKTHSIRKSRYEKLTLSQKLSIIRMKHSAELKLLETRETWKGRGGTVETSSDEEDADDEVTDSDEDSDDMDEESEGMSPEPMETNESEEQSVFWNGLFRTDRKRRYEDDKEENEQDMEVEAKKQKSSVSGGIGEKGDKNVF